MEINFRTKEKTNAAQEKAFLAGSGAERLAVFFQRMKNHKKVPRQNPEIKEEKKDNFIRSRYKND